MNWTSGDAVFYRSLDEATCFKLMNGSQSYIGKVSAPSLDEATCLKPNE